MVASGKKPIEKFEHETGHVAVSVADQLRAQRQTGGKLDEEPGEEQYGSPDASSPGRIPMAFGLAARVRNESQGKEPERQAEDGNPSQQSHAGCSDGVADQPCPVHGGGTRRVALVDTWIDGTEFDHRRVCTSSSNRLSRCSIRMLVQLPAMSTETAPRSIRNNTMAYPVPRWVAWSRWILMGLKSRMTPR